MSSRTEPRFAAESRDLGFCRRWVYYERHQYVHNAIRREKQLKNWSRKKITLIESLNPQWDDLSRDWGTAIDLEAALGTFYKKNKTKIPPLRREARLRSG